MIELRFRGKRIDNGMWVYGDISNNPLTCRSHIFSYDTKRSYVYEVICNTVGQYIGSKDMNKTDIYEGDIIQKEGSIGVVKYDPAVMGFIIDTISTGDTGFYDNMGVNFSFNEIEVIGNIYENPEMI